MINAGGSDNVEKIKKLMEKKNPCVCTIHFHKNSNKSYFLIGFDCQHPWYKPIFYWLHEMAACCYLGADLGNGLDHNFPSRLTDVTPYSSSDLLYFTLSPSYSLGQNYSKSKFTLLFALPGQKTSTSNSKSTKLF